MTTKRPSAIGLRKGLGTIDPATATADELADEAARVLARAAAPPRPPKPVRFTVDLDPGLHLYLREYATAFGTKASVIVRELLAELRDDPELAARVQARIWQTRA